MISHRIINIGIVAHVDAGKTSLTEKLLFHAGTIGTSGSVDKGTSITDWLEVEKDRGISVRTATASLIWKNIKINIIDTPGHVDFSSEVSRAFMAMDVVILVISSVEGIQGHTSTLWKSIRSSGKPCIVFINKCDRPGADIKKVQVSLKKEFKSVFLPINLIVNEGTSSIGESTILPKLNSLVSEEKIKELILNGDDQLLESYLNDDRVSDKDLTESIIYQISQQSIIPVISGSTKFEIGIKTLLETVSLLIKPVVGDKLAEPSGIIYKVEHDPKVGKVASIRMFSGTIRNRDTIRLNNKDEKVTQIRQLQGAGFKDTGSLVAGDTAAVCGLSSVIAGDTFGINDANLSPIKLSTSVLAVKVSPKNTDDYSRLIVALQELSAEDPELDLLWIKEIQEITIKIKGIIQLQVLEAVIKERYNIDVEFDDPAVIYKESPKNAFTVVEEYTMPKPCWAVLRFEVEPLETGTGVVYESSVGVNNIAIQYQQEVERNIPIALKQGIQGWEVTDLKIKLIGDEDHNVHSRAGDFGVATHMALMKGFHNNGTRLLEPILRYKIIAPEESMGSIVGNLSQLRATFESPLIEDSKCIIEGLIPVATSIGFPTKLASLTQGKGSYSASFNGYQECDLKLGKTTPYRGVNPLDRAKYILKARNALI